MKTKNLFVLVLIALVIRIWIFTPFIIPSSSMDTCLIKGDYVIVNTSQNLIGEYLPIKNEVLAFHYPLNNNAIKDKPVYIKRCVGLPGDSIIITDGFLTSDSSILLQHDYLIADPETVLNWDLLSKNKVHLGGKTNMGNWLLPLNNKQKEALEKQSKSLHFEMKLQPSNWFDLSIFPSDTLLKWNKDNYGPIYVPKKGDVLNLSTKNISLYKKIIEHYEDNELEVINSTVFINGKTTNKYQFKNNYYFLLGDNRHHSKDSRHWGFVPQNHLIGKCSKILFNVDNFSFDRVFKSVN